jgi:hypothetical protein
MPSKCKVEDCDKNVNSNGYCQKHYYRLKKHGTLELPIKPEKPKVCIRAGCNFPVKHLGLCITHYNIDYDAKPENKLRRRNNDLKRRFGITLEEYNSLLKAQDNKCPICEQPLDLVNTRHTHLDHDHITSKIRGVLHSKCNHLLGFAYENPQTLLNAIKYLQDNE